VTRLRPAGRLAESADVADALIGRSIAAPAWSPS